MDCYGTLEKNLKEIAKINSKELKVMFKEIGVSPAAFTQWKYGRRRPKVETIKKLADYFNITIDDLLLKEIKIEYKIIVDEK